MKINDLIKENYKLLDKNDIKLYSYIIQEKTDFVEKISKNFQKNQNLVNQLL